MTVSVGWLRFLVLLSSSLVVNLSLKFFTFISHPCSSNCGIVTAATHNMSYSPWVYFSANRKLAVVIISYIVNSQWQWRIIWWWWWYHTTVENPVHTAYDVAWQLVVGEIERQFRIAVQCPTHCIGISQQKSLVC